MGGQTRISFKLTSVRTQGRAKEVYDSVCLHGNAQKAIEHARYLGDFINEVTEAYNHIMMWAETNDLKVKFTTDHDGGGMRSWSVIEVTYSY